MDARAVLLTADEAAPLLGVASSTIATWLRRGRVQVAGYRHTGRRPARLYAWGDLLDAEESSRAGALTSGIR